jgi:hypothetical protein
MKRENYMPNYVINSELIQRLFQVMDYAKENTNIENWKEFIERSTKDLENLKPIIK